MTKTGRIARAAATISITAMTVAALAGPACADSPPPAAVPVTVGTVSANDMPIYVRGLGTVQAWNSVTVKSRVDGQITQVFFTEGQTVKQGDKLFEIDPRPYQAALEQAEAAKTRDEATLHSAQLDLDRYSALVGKGFQTRQSVDQQKAAVDSGRATVASDQAQIDAANLNLVYAEIRSPIDGRTGQRQVDIGNLVQASAATPLVSITQIKPIFVSFTVPQDQLDQIRTNQEKAPLVVDAYSNDDKTRLASGQLSLIDNQVDPTTGTIRLKAGFANDDEKLWPGAFVNARLVLSVQKGAITVPAQAVMAGNDKQYVYVVRDDDTVERRDVEPGNTESNMTVIRKGLRQGERVVVDGQFRLTDGARIRVVPNNAPAG